MLNDKVTITAKSGHGLRFVSGAEPFVIGHYPGNALFPGVLSIELITEVYEQLVREAEGQDGSCLTGIKNIRFLDQVRPGDVLNTEVKIIEKREDVCILSGQISSSQGKITAKGTFFVSFEPIENFSAVV